MKTIFLETAMILGEKGRYGIKTLFFREHQVLEILTSGPYFEYPPLVACPFYRSVDESTTWRK